VVVDDVLAEVDDDLAHGDHASARRRLREALVARPHRLDLRLRLAEVYRTIGDLPQAGRWSYLADEPVAAEVDAFRTACGDDASYMLEALAWGEDDEGEEDDDVLVTATAWQRIAELRRSVAAAQKADGGRGASRRPGQPAEVPYPFTPPAGIRVLTPPEPPRRKPRLRELVGLGLIFVGLGIVLLIVLGVLIGAIWLISGFVRHTYL